MKTTLALAALLMTSHIALAHNTATTAAQSPDGLKLIHVSDLALLQAGKDQVYIFDANKDETRMKDGMIPGAKMLTKVSDYDAQAILPADHNAKIVFYCANTMCTASHDAAKVAIRAHYTNVSVMADGIEGWKKAGKPTAKFNKDS